MNTRNVLESYLEGTRKAIAALDKAAEGGPVVLPEVVVEAAACTVAFTVCSLEDFDEARAIGNLLTRVMQECYRVGYLNGKADTQSLLGGANKE